MFNFLIGAFNDPQTIIMIILLVVMVAVLIILPMFTNKRRNKAINELHSSLRPGDVIKTVGGIVGTIVEIKDISPVDKEMVVETGVSDNKSTMVFDVQAVYQILSKADAPVAALAEQPFEEVKPQENAATVTESAEEEHAAEENVATEESKVEEVKTEESAAVAEEPKAEEAAPKKTAPRRKK